MTVLQLCMRCLGTLYAEEESGVYFSAASQVISEEMVPQGTASPSDPFYSNLRYPSPALY